MTKTTANLVAKVAEHLRIAASDTPLSTANNTKLTGYVNGVTAELRQVGEVWWADDAIPDECEDAMKLIVAARACVSCGKRNQGYEDGEEPGRDTLTVLRNSAEIEDLPGVYY